MKNEETLNIFGRDYLFITREQADHLENFRADSFLGNIDANTCEKKCYCIVFPEEKVKHKEQFFGVIKKFRDYEVGTIWIANHEKKTLTYDGLRSMRVADALKYLGSEDYPLLITEQEYKDIIKYYSKIFGAYFYRPQYFKTADSTIIISEQECQHAKQVIEEHNEQLLERRRKRKPKFGDAVITLANEDARYIGHGQALFKDSDADNYILKRDLIDMDIDWSMKDNCDLPSDSDLVNYMRDNNWTFAND